MNSHLMKAFTMKINRINKQCDLAALERCCTAEEKSFQSEGKVFATKDGPLIHIDRGAKVLAVAHLDSVMSSKHFAFLGAGKSIRLYSPQLDDRLGVFTILSLLPALGINVDVLLTTGEESGRSTAAHFLAEKDYNWMFSFDRGGTDVVMYQYLSKSMKDLLRVADFPRVSTGMNSDIAYLGHLGIVGFNFGTAYYDYHGLFAYCNWAEYLMQVKKFIKFFALNSRKKLPWERPKVQSYLPRGNHYSDDTGWWGEEKVKPSLLLACGPSLGCHSRVDDLEKGTLILTHGEICRHNKESMCEQHVDCYYNQVTRKAYHSRHCPEYRAPGNAAVTTDPSRCPFCDVYFGKGYLDTWTHCYRCNKEVAK